MSHPSVLDSSARASEPRNEGRVELVELPIEVAGCGYYRKEWNKRFWGRPNVIAAVQSVGRAWAEKYPQYPPFCVTEISAREGRTPGHKTHQDGSDVDFRPMRRDNLRRGVTVSDLQYSHERTLALVIELLQQQVCPVKSILFNDPRILAVTSFPGHHNHLHVAFPREV